MNTKNWKLKDVLLIAISAVLFGVVYLGCTYIGGVLYGMLTPFGMASLGYEPFYGIYFMAGAFGIYVMRKPGTGSSRSCWRLCWNACTATISDPSSSCPVWCRALALSLSLR